MPDPASDPVEQAADPVAADPVAPDARRSLADKFRSAFRGLGQALCEEFNFRLHGLAAVAVLAAGALLGLALEEWCLLVLCIAGVFAAELLNTALRAAGPLDHARIPCRHPRRARHGQRGCAGGGLRGRHRGCAGAGPAVRHRPGLVVSDAAVAGKIACEPACQRAEWRELSHCLALMVQSQEFTPCVPDSNLL